MAHHSNLVGNGLIGHYFLHGWLWPNPGIPWEKQGTTGTTVPKHENHMPTTKTTHVLRAFGATMFLWMSSSQARAAIACRVRLIFALSQGAIKTLQDSWREQQIAQGEQLRAYLAARACNSFQAVSPCPNIPNHLCLQ